MFSGIIRALFSTPFLWSGVSTRVFATMVFFGISFWLACSWGSRIAAFFRSFLKRKLVVEFREFPRMLMINSRERWQKFRACWRMWTICWCHSYNMEFSECFLLLLLWSVLCVCVCVCFEIFATKMPQSVITNVALQMQEASSQTAAAAALSKLLASLVATAGHQSDCCPSSACQELCWRLSTSCLSGCNPKP